MTFHLHQRKAGRIAMVLLLIHFILAIAAASNKSNTFDEIGHVTAGYTYWRFNDYRLHPENGKVPQRWMTLPLLVMHPTFPPADQELWHRSDVWQLGHQFFFTQNNATYWLVMLPRVMVALASTLLGWVVFALSRRLFSQAGGLLSVCLYAFSPTMLAHGAMATSDLLAALFLLLSVAAIARMSRAIDWTIVILGGLAMGAMVLCKTTWVLLAPMGVLIIAARMLGGTQVFVRWRNRWFTPSRTKQLLCLAGAVMVQLLIVFVMTWTFYGWRYQAFADYDPQRDVFYKDFAAQVDRSGAAAPMIRWAIEHRVLPEATLYGNAFVLAHADTRRAFLAGEYSFNGWWYFFPYAFAVKTTVGVLLLLVIAAGSALVRQRGRRWWRCLPLWVLIVVYLSAAMTSNLNIGHRHLLPLYPVIFILLGSCGAWLARRDAMRWVVALLLAGHIGASLWAYPNYLAYFNALAGGPRHGYRHLVDSSLDWGQDLPGLKAWLDAHSLNDPNHAADPTREPVYLSYFGTASPTHHGIRAVRLPSNPSFDDPRVNIGPLRPGYYCISATNLQNVYVGMFGKWNRQYEQQYHATAEIVRRYNGSRGDEQASAALLAELGKDRLYGSLHQFAQLRFARLCLELRQREPDAMIGYSILIYKVSEAELHTALFDTPVEMFDDPSIKGPKPR